MSWNSSLLILLIFFIFTKKFISISACPAGDEWTTTLEGNQCFQIFYIYDDPNPDVRNIERCDRNYKSSTFEQIYPMNVKMVVNVFIDKVKNNKVKLNPSANKSILVTAKVDRVYFDSCVFSNFIGVDIPLTCQGINFDHYVCHLISINPNRHCRFSFDTIREPCEYNKMKNRCERKVTFIRNMQASGKYRKCGIPAISVTDVQPCEDCMVKCTDETDPTKSSEGCDCLTGTKYIFKVLQKPDKGLCTRQAEIKEESCAINCDTASCCPSSSSQGGRTDLCRWETWSNWGSCSNKCGEGNKSREKSAKNKNTKECSKSTEAETISCWEYTECDTCQVYYKQDSVWGLCSKTCGRGVQTRPIEKVFKGNDKTGRCKDLETSSEHRRSCPNTQCPEITTMLPAATTAEVKDNIWTVISIIAGLLFLLLLILAALFFVSRRRRAKKRVIVKVKCKPRTTQDDAKNQCSSRLQSSSSSSVFFSLAKIKSKLRGYGVSNQRKQDMKNVQGSLPIIRLQKKKSSTFSSLAESKLKADGRGVSNQHKQDMKDVQDSLPATQRQTKKLSAFSSLAESKSIAGGRALSDQRKQDMKNIQVSQTATRLQTKQFNYAKHNDGKGVTYKPNQHVRDLRVSMLESEQLKKKKLLKSKAKKVSPDASHREKKC